MKATRLPPGTVVMDAEYVFFIGSVLAKLCEEYNLRGSRLLEYLERAEFDPTKITHLAGLIDLHAKGKVEFEPFATQLFTCFDMPQIEEVVSQILVGNGYRYTDPNTRGEMVQKLFASITTSLVTERKKAVCIGAFIDGAVHRLIARE